MFKKNKSKKVIELEMILETIREIIGEKSSFLKIVDSLIATVAGFGVFILYVMGGIPVIISIIIGLWLSALVMLIIK